MTALAAAARQLAPNSIASDGTDVWVANEGDQSITGFPT